MPRLRRAVRDQVEYRPLALEQLLPADHEARVVWEYVAGMDLSRLLGKIRAVEGHVGRNATDPRILMALWLYATLDGEGSARELDRLCHEHVAYQWICGGVSLNYHTLADFRVAHAEVLDRLLTAGAASLMHEGLVTLNRVAQDGMRVRANAGSSSFRRGPTLWQCLRAAKEQVANLRAEVELDPDALSKRRRSAKERAVRQRQVRIERALEELVEVETKMEARVKGSREKARASTTDPEARRMKMGDGGFRPAYNVQFATTAESGVIVGVAVTNSGSDAGQMAPMVEQIEERFGEKPKEHLVDGGFSTLAGIEAVAEDGTKVYAPVKEVEPKRAKGIDPFAPLPGDSPAVAEWRQRMGTEEAKAVYRVRSATAEWSNAQARNRGMQQFRVRGSPKVLAVALWFALAHNLHQAVALRAKAKNGS